MDIRIVEGDLLAQETDAIVNPWNRNIVPWWLLAPHGVSGEIKRRAGLQPFYELRRKGWLSLGEATATSAGRLSYTVIIHVATITLWGKSTPGIVSCAVKNAIQLAEVLKLRSLAFPLLGSGSGNLEHDVAEQVMLQACTELSSNITVVIVRFPTWNRTMTTV